MRPLRFLLSLASCIAAFSLLLYVRPWGDSTEEDIQRQSSIGAYFNWRSPSSLFPPSAIISLTDDNSTFFPARPAAFGPLLPANSLSGQLWIGSGFGDDHVGRSAAEGELGCSDVPGWNDGNYASGGMSLNDAKSSWAYSQDSNRSKRRRDVAEDEDGDEEDEQPTKDDGTDDHLHHPLPPSADLKTGGGSTGSAKKATHADIQSLQESAEIAGKIVLLSRGGCGFLEKVKWVQRRGGIALIVGDDIRRGPLVTMYARGDTSNVTIPSLFISHTTAHLLTTLVPSGSIVDGLSPEEAERLGLALGDKSDVSGAQKDAAIDKPNFTTTTAATKSTSPAKSHLNGKSNLLVHPLDEQDHANESEKVSWLGLLLGKGGNSPDSRRPPGSGHIGWVLQEDFVDEDSNRGRPGKQSTTVTTSRSAPGPTPDQSSGDGFVIGVQDWRDPDLVAHQKEQLLPPTSSSVSSTTVHSGRPEVSNGLKGGSITPGSGEYAKALHDAIDLPASRKSNQANMPRSKAASHSGGSRSWLGHFFRSDKQTTDSTSTRERADMLHTPSQLAKENEDDGENEPEPHGGLWVTLTPTSMSSSPFFDTLLVLVVSPLVTLTIVYALLLLRSRIRRRRWRAPKSVVERLPVRTYQTMPSTTSSSTTSSVSSRVNATTPLLPSEARPIGGRPRPRSRTASEVPIQPSSSLRSDSMASPSLDQIEEKRAAGLSEWRRRYGGSQKECVVCLEEYVDGVSRVMSLPCGHEFHAECITPWLTTRRRTCPICKGDVVRSLARSAGSTSVSPPQNGHHDDDDSDDVQEQAAVTRNDDPAAAQPMSREDEAFEDLERGIGSDRNR